MKFTPGPWRAIIVDDHGRPISPVVVKDTSVGGMDWVADLNKGRSMAEVTANAHLIAAAPELLEACRALIDMITDNRLHGPEVYAACDVIAKAEGGDK